MARELREHLIALGAEIGGHFAGSLGAVELTVALHTVFDTPHDRIVWDVGHQAYGHKALTGRREALRADQARGRPGGFLRRCESPYDVFGAGPRGHFDLRRARDRRGRARARARGGARSR